MFIMVLVLLLSQHTTTQLDIKRKEKSRELSGTSYVSVHKLGRFSRRSMLTSEDRKIKTYMTSGLRRKEEEKKAQFIEAKPRRKHLEKSNDGNN